MNYNHVHKVIDFPFALSNAILKYEVSREYKAVDYPGSNKTGAHRDLVLTLHCNAHGYQKDFK